MSKLITLRDKYTQNPIYPVTSVDAVITESGESFSSVMQAKFSELELRLKELEAETEAAKSSVSTLTGLSRSEVSQEDLEELKSKVNTNSNNVTALSTEVEILNTIANDLLAEKDLTDIVAEEINKVPTSSAVNNYVQSVSNSILEFLIDNTNVEPDYLPRETGQILVNGEDKKVYIASGKDNKWFIFEASEILQLEEEPQVVFEVISDTLRVNSTGNSVEVSGDTLTFNTIGTVNGDTLVL